MVCDILFLIRFNKYNTKNDVSRQERYRKDFSRSRLWVGAENNKQGKPNLIKRQ